MKLFMRIFILALFCLTSGAMTRESYQQAPYQYDKCCRPVYECGCNPLYCGTYSGQLHAGVAPIIWTKRGEVDLLSCSTSTENPVFQLAEHFPKFKTLYKLPWTFGGIFAYSWTDNFEVYLEFNYLQATPKRKDNIPFAFIFPNLTPQQELLVRLGKYNLIDAYIGWRYYTNRFCNWISYFTGLKVGVTMHRSSNGLLSVNGQSVVLVPATNNNCTSSNTSSNNHFFKKNTVITGGFNLGVDICFCGGWSFVITGEVVASCAPRLPRPAVFTPPLPAPASPFTNIIFTGLGTEFRFPVTFGIKKAF